MKPAIGSRNRLIRRLGVHANMTGLFRFGEAVQSRDVRSDGPAMSSAANFSSLPLAKAFIPTPEPAGEIDLAQSYPVPTIPVESHPASPMSAPPAGMDTSPTLPFEPPKSVPARMDTPTSAPSGTIFRASEPEQVESPAAGEKSRPSGGDPVWNRLQTIFNKHREKNTSQEAASQPQPPAADPSSPDAPAPAREEGNQIDAPSGLELPVGNQPGAPANLSIQTKRESSAAPARIIQAAGKSSPPNLLPASPLADETALTKPADNLLSDETGESSGTEQPDRHVSQPEMEPPETVTALQPLPLEAVWAVETLREPRNPNPPTLEESQEEIPGEEEIDRKAKNAHAEQSSVQRSVAPDLIVRSALQDVQPAQASDSGIEFIPPRRPRPPSPAAGANTPVAENSAKPANISVPMNALQRQVETGSENETAKPGMVPTEIGPLPEDLWNLVGEATPAAGNMVDASQESPSSGETSIGAMPAQVRNTAPAPSSPGPAAQAPLVQRQVASDASAEAESATPDAGKDAVGEQANEEVNIEELARQVYSELKHRLGLEWERLHRR